MIPTQQYICSIQKPEQILIRQLDFRGWSIEQFSKISNISVMTLEMLICGKIKINKSMAEKFAEVFNTPVRLWTKK